MPAGNNGKNTKIDGAELPDDLRRRDRASEDAAVSPDAVPVLDEIDVEEDVALLPDGGAPDHPIHDEPMEDLQPEDFEALIDDAARGKLERRIDDETIDPRATQEFAAGSSDPLDQRNPRPIKPR